MSITIFIIQILSDFLSVKLFLGFNEILSKGWAFFCAIIILLLGESFILSMYSDLVFGVRAPKWMQMISYISMVFCFYLIILYGVSFILQLIKLYPNTLRHYKFTETMIFILASGIITIYGYYNATTTKYKNVDITTYKPNIDFSIAFVSDIHIGTFSMTKKRLDEAVEKINEENPDIIILGGDIVDRFVGSIYAGDYDKPLKKLKAKYGVYAVLGNHEYYRNKIDNVEKVYEKLGMTVLRDEVIKIGKINIELIGLDDKTKPYFGLGKLKPINSLAKGDDFKVLVSHNPMRQSEAVENNIDLFLAGHTHAGQLFPLQWILKLMYDTVWGYDKFGQTQVYVSSGFGAWGPPLRVGNDSEIVFLEVKSR